MNENKSQQASATSAPMMPQKGGRVPTMGAIGAAIVSTMMAAPCIVGLILTLLGLGGSSLFLKLDTLRPYLLASTICSLAAGFYLTHLRPRAGNCTETTGQRRHPARGASWIFKLTFWATALMAFVFLVLPYLLTNG
ncbi:MAG TPA: hypothetical protein VNO21_13710 [Polyangiaceae bacterium]|nr:hypothetical protein [Polyangiaceae bacterium]